MRFGQLKRREFITLVVGAVAAWPLAVRAQQPWGRPLIALLSPLSAATATRNIAGFRNGLRDLGLIEGRNIFLALRFAGGVAERMPVLARELVDLKPDVLIAAPESSLAAVRALTTTVPILTIWLRDPVLTGTVESIAHPGQNVTGTWIAGDDALVGKRLELLKEAVPG
jgi:putative tryptophan/tyrosine transport system substrate-binding protein